MTGPFAPFFYLVLIMIDFIAQLCIGLFGVTAVFLSQHPAPVIRRWSAVVGLIAQPFWFYTAFVHGQWGIFFLAFLYTYSWSTGIWHNWIVPRRAPMTATEYANKIRFGKK